MSAEPIRIVSPATLAPVGEVPDEGREGVTAFLEKRAARWVPGADV